MEAAAAGPKVLIVYFTFTKQTGLAAECSLTPTRSSREPAGNVTLWAGDKQIGEDRIDHTVAMRFAVHAGTDVGRDNGITVDPAYRDQAPYPFTGTVKKVVFDRRPAPHEHEKPLHQSAHHATAAAARG